MIEDCNRVAALKIKICLGCRIIENILDSKVDGWMKILKIEIQCVGD